MDVYRRPNNMFVAGFIGAPKINLLSGEVVQAGAAEAAVRLTSGDVIRVSADASRAKAGDRVTLGVRPEHFEVGAQSNTLTATVGFVEALGATSYAYGSLAGSKEELTAQLAPDVAVRPGELLVLGVPAEDAHLFDAAGQAYRRADGALTTSSP
jgi:multiple sugar transport system ATP-binding protein